MASAQVVGQSGLAAAVQELRRAALAVRRDTQRFCNTVAHLTVALHGVACYAACNVGCQCSLAVLQRGPQLSLVHQQVIVVAELVAFLDLAVLVVQVIIDAVVSGGVVA